NVRGMAANRHLARAVMDGGFFELRRQLDYKARLYGSPIVLASRWYPSSKTCLAAASSSRRWPWRTGRSAVKTVGSRQGAITMPLSTSLDWPQALRCQPVEKHALARGSGLA